MTALTPLPSSVIELCIYTRCCLDEIRKHNEAIDTLGTTFSIESLKAIRLKTQVEQKAQLDFIQSQTKDLLSRIEDAANPRILEIALLFGQFQIQHDKLITTLNSLIDSLELDSYLGELEKGLKELYGKLLKKDPASLYEELQKGIEYLEYRKSELSGMQGLRFSLIKESLSTIRTSLALATDEGDVEMDVSSLSTASAMHKDASAKRPNFLAELEELMGDIPQEGPLTSGQKKRFYRAFASDAYIEYTEHLYEKRSLPEEDFLRLQSLELRMKNAYKQAVIAK